MMISSALEAGASSHRSKRGDFLAALARPVDQRVDGGGAAAALAAHHRGRLAGEGGELHLAVGVLGQMAGERGLAGAGIAEQAEHLRRAVGAGLVLEPVGDGVERGVLMGGELRHGGSNRPYRLNAKEQNMNLDGRGCVDYIPSPSPVDAGAVMTRPQKPARAAPDNARRGQACADRAGLTVERREAQRPTSLGARASQAVARVTGNGRRRAAGFAKLAKGRHSATALAPPGAPSPPFAEARKKGSRPTRGRQRIRVTTHRLVCLHRRPSYYVDMSRHMDARKSQSAFAALAQPTRLKAFRRLVAAHPQWTAGGRDRGLLQGAAQHHVDASRGADARRADRGDARRPLDELPRQSRRLPRTDRLHAARLLRRPAGNLRAGGRGLQCRVLRAKQ